MKHRKHRKTNYTRKYYRLAVKRFYANQKDKRDKARERYDIAELNAQTKKELQTEKIQHAAQEARTKRINSIVITLISCISFILLVIICCEVGKGKI